MEKQPATRPISPGEFLKEVILNDLGFTIQEMALSFGITTKEAYAILSNRAPLNPEICTRAERLTFIPSAFWCNLQIEYHIWEASHILSQVVTNASTEPQDENED